MNTKKILATVGAAIVGLATAACAVYLELQDIFRPPAQPQMQQLAQVPFVGKFPLTDIRVIDGDTFEGTIHLGLGVQLRDTIRANNYDAWESRKIRRTVEVADDEVAKGKLASAFVAGLISESKHVTIIVAEKRDAYGRVLGSIDIDGVDLGETMRANGHTR